ncbi:UPF0565 protein C2orf69 homolog isoform X3 [Cryptotermes secundus]|uniref:UPF0565 protein C2orf69 homolog isoform X3 n=1 Tax=Cryptotermes secundus TaxID=105785 RepID=UPI001454D68F|nr:UPF0565 protein C2orf69 homolog isoform X3 [Cryptotermes secundus]
MIRIRTWNQYFTCFVSFFHCWTQDSTRKLGRMLGTPPPACPVRLCGVTGYDGRINDVVYCHPSVRAEQDMAVVFFGGDVQDFPENMENHRDNKNYVKWNLESTAVLLHSYFPDSHIVVVRPSRMEFKTFSCYDNFVPCNNCGAPDHTPTHYALQHLERLLQGISQRLRTMPVSELLPPAPDEPGPPTEEAVIDDRDGLQPQEEEDEEMAPLWWREGLNLDKAHLVLIGFSKGCVVLNQFIYEFHYLKTLTPDDDTMMRLVSRIQDMYWLDGGHAGGKNTWITSRSLLETLTRLGIGIHIHVTPYQVHDERRPWIRKEEKTFGDLLRRLGAPVQRTLHFENQVASLYTHFEVLNAFRQAAK